MSTRTKGFTLVELVVVIAILGIPAVVALSHIADLVSRAWLAQANAPPGSALAPAAHAPPPRVQATNPC